MPTKKNVIAEVKTKLPPIRIQRAKLIYKNFGGVKKKFNPAGSRNFHIVLEPDIATKLERDGWNVRWHDPREEQDPAWASIKVALRFDIFPPRIILVSSKGRTVLDEDTVEILDWAEIEDADVILNPSSWQVNDKQGIKAYLRKLKVTISDADYEMEFDEAPASKQLEENED